MYGQTHYVTETQIIQRLAADQDCRWIWTYHALKQMLKRKINANDVIHALMNGQVILEEYKSEILWRVAGGNIDGNHIEVVVSADDEAITVKVITAI